MNPEAFSGLQSVSRFGYLGVNLFFIISGFVILWSSQNKGGTDFIVSRVLRLYPGLWICIFLTSGALVLSGAPPSFRQIVVNFTMLPSVFNAAYIDGVYWTLFVELKFYAFVFIVLVVGAMRNMDAVVGGWLACSLAAAASLTPHWLNSLALVGFGPFFISGWLFYLIQSDRITRLRGLMLSVSCALCVFLAVEQQSGFMTLVTTTSSLIVGCVIIIFHILFLFIALARPILPNIGVWYRVGALTYPLYLLHNQIGKMLRSWASLAVSAGPALLLALTAVYSLAWIVAVFLEPQVRKMLKSVLQPVSRTSEMTVPLTHQQRETHND